MAKYINRLKVVLAEQRKTNLWLAEQLGKDPSTISKKLFKFIFEEI